MNGMEGSREKTPDWLFPPLSRQAQELLDDFPGLLAKVWPLKKSHAESLPRDIAELSTLLTSSRSGLDIPYWSKPGFISAYLYYFMPWNLLRICRLLEGLPLQAPVQKDGKSPVLLDLGAGPLTVPLAMWIAREDWRRLPLVVAACDKSPQPLRLGLELFQTLAAKTGVEPWKARLEKASLKKLRWPEFRDSGRYLWLATLANVFNEVMEGHRRNKRVADEEIVPLEEFFASADAAGCGSILIVEPGTRQGGTLVALLRRLALEHGFHPASPCTHSGRCPLDDPAGRQGLSGYGDSWCHFTFAADGAPAWLVALSRKAGLEKRSLSLAPLLLERKQQPENRCLRVISRPFKTAYGNNSRYACGSQGLGLLPEAADLPNGSRIVAQPTKERDVKSGAVIYAENRAKTERRPAESRRRSRKKN